jgi:hypothetical protein
MAHGAAAKEGVRLGEPVFGDFVDLPPPRELVEKRLGGAAGAGADLEDARLLSA